MKPTLMTALSLATLVISATGFGRQNSAPQNEDDHTLSVDVDLVNVLFTVVDKEGKFVRDLKRENIKVYEDGKPQVITSFSAEADLPLNIGLLIDTSASVIDR